MFATGSHDGAVRIWTKRPEEDDELDHPVAGAYILRTSSPLGMLPHERSDTPITQRDSDSVHDLLSDDVGLLLRDQASGD